jgi:catechol 2,3-dioxygenase-like lactoylglutathione lyase family enzyme
VGLQFIDHFTIHVRTADLGKVVRFYADALDLHDGNRPPFDFPGNWLYAGDKPVVHLVGTDYDTPLGQTAPASGQLDHISFRSSGLVRQRERLRELGLKFDEAIVPASPIHQIFVRDPAGIMVELNYDKTSEGVV